MNSDVIHDGQSPVEYYCNNNANQGKHIKL